MTIALQHEVIRSQLCQPALLDGADYWTPARRAAAKPVPLVRTSSLGNPVRAETGGDMGYTSPYRGLGGPFSAAPSRARLRRRRSADPLGYPRSLSGALFFSHGGSDWVGFAALVGPDVLVSAGHCLFNSAWSSHVTFYPSYPYRVGGDPCYRFDAVHLAAPTGWVENGDRAYDYGMIGLAEKPGQVLGWLGLLWNAATVGRTWDELSAEGVFDRDVSAGTTQALWLTDVAGSPRTYINGLASLHVPGDSVRGPHFTEQVLALYRCISEAGNRR